MRNKKALSDLTITILIVILSLVAILGVWFVVNKVINSQEQFTIYKEECFNVIDCYDLPTLLNSSCDGYVATLGNQKPECDGDVCSIPAEFCIGTQTTTEEIKCWMEKSCEKKEVDSIQKKVISSKFLEDCSIDVGFGIVVIQTNSSKNCLSDDSTKWETQNISKKYLQENSEWLDENCECIGGFDITFCSLPNKNGTNGKYCGYKKESKNGYCSKYSCLDGRYEVEVRK